MTSDAVTGQALVALREHSEHPKNRKSLDWLESIQGTILSPESVALAHIAFGLYGRQNATLAERLHSLPESDTFPWSVQAIAWAALAFSESSQWLNLLPSTNS